MRASSPRPPGFSRAVSRPSRAFIARRGGALGRAPRRGALGSFAPRASRGGSNDDGSFDLSTLAERVADLRRQEASGSSATMRVIVLDATLPGQRLGLRFDAKDAKRRLHAGTELGPLAEVGDTFCMLGQAPSSGQIIPMGVEVRLARVEPFPDGSGDVEVELRGIRRVRIEGQPFNENGVAMAKVTFMDWAPEDTPSAPADLADQDLANIRGSHPAAGDREYLEEKLRGMLPSDDEDEEGEEESTRPTRPNPADERRPPRAKKSKLDALDPESAALASALPSLAREWERLVREGGHERREGHLDLVKSHIGDVPPVEEPARLAAWVGALINPIPALGVAYEIRPALLMARDTRGMLKVATEGITLSIERLRKSNGEQKNT
jgi:hypothetical protein